MLQSRKWKAVLLDSVFSIIILIVVVFVLDPKWQDFALKLIALIQAPVVAYVLAVAYEDGQAKRAVTYNDSPEVPAEKGK